VGGGGGSGGGGGGGGGEEATAAVETLSLSVFLFSLTHLQPPTALAVHSPRD